MSPDAGAAAPRARDLRILFGAAGAAVALAALLRWPGLTAGFHSDDYQQLAMLRGDYLLSRPFWDLFWFGPRSAGELARLLDFGFDPWWTAPGHRIAMLRPLSSASSSTGASRANRTRAGVSFVPISAWAAK